MEDTGRGYDDNSVEEEASILIEPLAESVQDFEPDDAVFFTDANGIKDMRPTCS
jgi:hypothetical protein